MPLLIKFSNDPKGSDGSVLIGPVERAYMNGPDLVISPEVFVKLAVEFGIGPDEMGAAWPDSIASFRNGQWWLRTVQNWFLIVEFVPWDERDSLEPVPFTAAVRRLLVGEGVLIR